MSSTDDDCAADDERSEKHDRSSEAEGVSEQSSSGALAPWTDAMQDMAPYLDLGWRLTAAAAGPPILGHFCVDFWFDTTPWGVLGGAVLGIAAAAVQLRRLQHEFAGS